jgi:hypothetical protein
VQLGGKEKRIINQESKEVAIPANIMVGSSGVSVLKASLFDPCESIFISNNTKDISRLDHLKTMLLLL